MILRILILVLTLGSCLTSSATAGCERGDHLISDTGGAQGTPGAPGIPGAPGTLDFSDFYALMPGDNTGTIGAGTPVLFPQTGSTNGVLVPISSSTFLLPAIGTYWVMFQVSVAEPGQLVLRLNGTEIPISLVGRATGTSQIVGVSLLTTTSPNSFLEVVNPSGNTPALTITPIAGGTQSVSAHLVIIRIQ